MQLGSDAARHRPSEHPAAPVSGVRRIARRVFAAMAWLFTACVVAQVFLAGLSIFVNPGRWVWHRAGGGLILLVGLLLLAAAFAGRVSAGRRRLAIAAFVLLLVQGATADIRGLAGAFHPVNALLLFAVSLRLVRREPAAAHPAP